jgi:hypothetical protein
MARNPGTTQNGASFDQITIEAVWQKGTPVPGYPAYRRDTCGALMLRNRYGLTMQHGWDRSHLPGLQGRFRRLGQSAAAAMGEQPQQG